MCIQIIQENELKETFRVFSKDDEGEYMFFLIDILVKSLKQV